MIHSLPSLPVDLTECEESDLDVVPPTDPNTELDVGVEGGGVSQQLNLGTDLGSLLPRSCKGRPVGHPWRRPMSHREEPRGASR